MWASVAPALHVEDAAAVPGPGRQRGPAVSTDSPGVREALARGVVCGGGGSWGLDTQTENFLISYSAFPSHVRPRVLKFENQMT